MARSSKARYGRAGEARNGQARCGAAWRGVEWHGRHGMVWQAVARSALARQAKIQLISKERRKFNGFSVETGSTHKGRCTAGRRSLLKAGSRRPANSKGPFWTNAVTRIHPYITSLSGTTALLPKSIVKIRHGTSLTAWLRCMNQLRRLGVFSTLSTKRRSTDLSPQLCKMLTDETQLLSLALRELDAFKRKFNSLSELAAVFAAIEEIRKRGLHE